MDAIKSLRAILLPGFVAAATLLVPGPSLGDAAGNLATRETPAATDPYRMLSMACPGNGVRYSDLEAGRIVNGKLALAKAIRDAAQQRDDEIAYGTRDELTGDYVFARTPKQVAKVFRRGLGGDHFLARSMDALAALTDVTTQAPLDGVNTVTGKIIEQGGRVLRIDSVPELKLKSRITADNAGVSLSTRW